MHTIFETKFRDACTCTIFQKSKYALTFFLSQALSIPIDCYGTYSVKPK